MKSFRERCREEVTRDVIFLLRYRKSRRSQAWHVDSVWLSREEAEEFRKNHTYRWPSGSDVYGIPSSGELAKLLEST